MWRSEKHCWTRWFKLFPAFLMAGALSFAEPVRVEGGLVTGKVEDGLRVYRGIPFAAPPVGDLRWRSPGPVPKWEGVRVADKFGPPCVQSNPALAGLEAPSEDCLYLNVWTPAKRASDRLPVMVWIHGGGFTAGATSEAFYSGEELAKRGVVFVSIAYRLGVFGFLAHPELSAESPQRVSGNYGLLDMIAGLKWVRNNIAAFGGDPTRVTIFGESAGGIAVSMLCASPLAKGLFHRAISQSGGSFGPVRSGGGGPGENVQPLADAEHAGTTWAASLGAAGVSDLRKMPADRLLSASRGHRGLGWPVMDGWVIPDDQYRLYQAGRFNDVPVLAGYNSDECALFQPAQTPESFIESVRQRYGPCAERLLALYPPGREKMAKTARDLMRDTAFGWHNWTWARLQSKTGKSKVFLYFFDQHPQYPPDSPRADFGAVHGAELPYVFQHLGGPRQPVVTADDKAIAEAMAAYWTNFAKQGDPNGSGLPTWPAFAADQPQVMYFQRVPHPGPLASAEGLKALDAYFEWRRTGNSAACAVADPASAQ